MKILVINCGSSSLKYTVFDMPSGTALCTGIFSQLESDAAASVTHKLPNEAQEMIKVINKKMLKTNMSHTEAISELIGILTDDKTGVLAELSEIKAVGHRVLHAGERFSESVLVNGDVKKAIQECIPLGPLHNPANLNGIEAFGELLSDVPQVAVFDTAFHQTMPEYAYMYALPYEYYERHGIRKYGFHGTSHRFVSKRCIELMGNPEHSRIITCHLGNGSSISAVVDGKCYDTTMGLTPLEGIMMGTRCGSIDPAIIGVLMEKESLTIQQVDEVLNKKSGMLGITGKTSDNIEIERLIEQGDERAILVEKMVCHQLTKYIGSLAAAMGGVDAVVFTGGIGENNPTYRARASEKLSFIGVDIDEKKNNTRGEEIEFSTSASKVRMFVIPTNEELMIAQDTYELVNCDCRFVYSDALYEEMQLPDDNRIRECFKNTPELFAYCDEILGYYKDNGIDLLLDFLSDSSSTLDFFEKVAATKSKIESNLQRLSIYMDSEGNYSETDELKRTIIIKRAINELLDSLEDKNADE